MTMSSSAMAAGEGRTNGPDTRLLQDLIGDMADAASHLEAAAEGLAEHRNGQYDINVLGTRLDAIEQAVAPLMGDDSLLVRVKVLEALKGTVTIASVAAVVSAVVAVVAVALLMMG